MTNNLIHSTFHLEGTLTYAVAGNGFCKDWVYLPEGGYPELLTITDTLFSEDRVQECMNRCVDASEQSFDDTQYSGNNKISDIAFYVRTSDERCGCSSGPCQERQIRDNDYMSYFIHRTDYGTLLRLKIILS